MNIMMRVILLIFGLLASSGCTLLNLSSTPEQQFRDFKNYTDWEKRQEERFASYIGKKTLDIEKEFGKPRRIYKADPPAYELYEDADELWIYNELPIDEVALHKLYFKEKKLVLVQVSGRRQSRGEKVASYFYL
jgi:hypothetical protein